MANTVLESFGESSKACVTNFSHPPEKLKGKENPDLPSVCSNYWPPNMALSLYFNHLVLSTFRQSRSAIPNRSAKPIASKHHTVQVPLEKTLREFITPNSLTWLRIDNLFILYTVFPNIVSFLELVPPLNIFHIFMCCNLWPYILWPLDFQIKKRIVFAETIWGNTVSNLV
jgi:hypothetical protein